MLTVKAKHATMLLTVSEVEGLSDGMEELSDEELTGAVANGMSSANKQLPAHPSVVMVSGEAAFSQSNAFFFCRMLWQGSEDLFTSNSRFFLETGF